MKPPFKAWPAWATTHTGSTRGEKRGRMAILQVLNFPVEDFSRWWWSKNFIFIPTLGKWSNLTSIFFQMGWNHQVVFGFRNKLEVFGFESLSSKHPPSRLYCKGLLEVLRFSGLAIWVEGASLVEVYSDGHGLSFGAKVTIMSHPPAALSAVRL